MSAAAATVTNPTSSTTCQCGEQVYNDGITHFCRLSQLASWYSTSPAYSSQEYGNSWKRRFPLGHNDVSTTSARPPAPYSGWDYGLSGAVEDPRCADVFPYDYAFENSSQPPPQSQAQSSSYHPQQAHPISQLQCQPHPSSSQIQAQARNIPSSSEHSRHEPFIQAQTQVFTTLSPLSNLPMVNTPAAVVQAQYPLKPLPPTHQVYQQVEFDIPVSTILSLADDDVGHVHTSGASVATGPEEQNLSARTALSSRMQSQAFTTGISGSPASALPDNSHNIDNNNNNNQIHNQNQSHNISPYDGSGTSSYSHSHTHSRVPSSAGSGSTPFGLYLGFRGNVKEEEIDDSHYSGTGYHVGGAVNSPTSPRSYRLGPSVDFGSGSGSSTSTSTAAVSAGAGSSSIPGSGRLYTFAEELDADISFSPSSTKHENPSDLRTTQTQAQARSQTNRSNADGFENTFSHAEHDHTSSSNDVGLGIGHGGLSSGLISAPLRATNATADMRKMMGVFRLDPFALHAACWGGSAGGQNPDSSIPASASADQVDLNSGTVQWENFEEQDLEDLDIDEDLDSDSDLDLDDGGDSDADEVVVVSKAKATKGRKNSNPKGGNGNGRAGQKNKKRRRRKKKLQYSAPNPYEATSVGPLREEPVMLEWQIELLVPLIPGLDLEDDEDDAQGMERERGGHREDGGSKRRRNLMSASKSLRDQDISPPVLSRRTTNDSLRVPYSSLTATSPRSHLSAHSHSLPLTHSSLYRDHRGPSSPLPSSFDRATSLLGGSKSWLGQPPRRSPSPSLSAQDFTSRPILSSSAASVADKHRDYQRYHDMELSSHVVRERDTDVDMESDFSGGAANGSRSMNGASGVVSHNHAVALGYYNNNNHHSNYNHHNHNHHNHLHTHPKRSHQPQTNPNQSTHLRHHPQSLTTLGSGYLSSSLGPPLTSHGTRLRFAFGIGERSPSFSPLSYNASDGDRDRLSVELESEFSGRSRSPEF